MSGFVLTVSLIVTVGIVLYLTGTLVRSIYVERRRAGVKAILSNFGLSIALAVLFFTSWIGQAVAEWGHFVTNQQAHGEPVSVSEYLVEFSQSTLENWQSEFLQLFSFVVLAALYIHRGSAESKDSDEEMSAALRRIERRLQELVPGSVAGDGGEEQVPRRKSAQKRGGQKRRGRKKS